MEAETMVLGSSLMFFLNILGWMEFRLCRNGYYFQACTSAELSLSRNRYNHVFNFFGMECVPVRKAC
jgi:hypothetical protein